MARILQILIGHLRGDIVDHWGADARHTTDRRIQLRHVGW